MGMAHRSPDWDRSRIRTTSCICNDVCAGVATLFSAFHHVIRPGRTRDAPPSFLQPQGFCTDQSIQPGFWTCRWGSVFLFRILMNMDKTKEDNLS